MKPGSKIPAEKGPEVISRALQMISGPSALEPLSLQVGLNEFGIAEPHQSRCDADHLALEIAVLYVMPPMRSH